jgi:hypothetical protein
MAGPSLARRDMRERAPLGKADDRLSDVAEWPHECRGMNGCPNRPPEHRVPLERIPQSSVRGTLGLLPPPAILG